MSEQWRLFTTTQSTVFGVPVDIQYKYFNFIRSSVHIYFDHDTCLEVIVLDGNGEEIAELAGAIIALKGVKFSKLTTVSPDEKTLPFHIPEKIHRAERIGQNPRIFSG
ncbi:MAG: CopG family transcriptional regulator, nickel-responsive regulator [Euryarchaeota archaeon]|nr:CopG family transcriptional regulator, nickel-responsive regulator [Euryarchaeota archaeon]